MVQIGVGLRAGFDRAAPEDAVRLAAGFVGGEHGAGDLAFAEIVAHGLAELGLIGGVVQRVVHQLERGAEIEAVIGQRLFLRLAAARDHGADLAGGGEERGRLALDHV